MIKNKAILVVNIGSSSFKYALFFIIKGKLCEIGRVKIVFSHWDNMNNMQRDLLTTIETFLQKKGLNSVDIIVHRVVHGGTFIEPVKITAAVVKRLERYTAFAALHNPYNLFGINVCQKLFPASKQYAVFDTSFHQTIKEKAKVYAIPFLFYKKGIYRYGFHGYNFAYCTAIMQNYLDNKKSKLIICHLGNGCSITAVKDGKSVDTSMGFTPVEGLLMGTRAGDIDSGLIEYMLRKYSIKNVFSILQNESGLLGISGISNDVKKLHAISLKEGGKAKRAMLALDVFVYRIVKYIGAYYTVLGGCDAIVFTGGIGENAWYIREEVCKYFSFLGLKLDTKKNRLNKKLISAKGSSLKVFVIAANEELQMAKDIYRRS